MWIIIIVLVIAAVFAMSSRGQNKATDTVNIPSNQSEEIEQNYQCTEVLEDISLHVCILRFISAIQAIRGADKYNDEIDSNNGYILVGLNNDGTATLIASCSIDYLGFDLYQYLGRRSFWSFYGFEPILDDGKCEGIKCKIEHLKIDSMLKSFDHSSWLNSICKDLQDVSNIVITERFSNENQARISFCFRR